MLTYFRKSILLVALLSLAASRSVQAAAEVINITPTPESTVIQLPFINVIFNEAVLGVNATDLLINGGGSTRVTTNNPNDYTFYFPVPPTGTVLVAWSSSHGITDTALVPFTGTNWTYTLDTNSAPPLNVVISEFLADNGSGIQDENGTRADWIELLNRGPLEANIGGWFISDDRLNLTKWKFPAGMPPIAVNGFLRIWASEKNRTNPLAPLHLNFRLSKNPGSFLALSDARTNIVSSFNPYPEQFEDISYGRDRVDPEVVGYFNTPTPGAANTVGGSGFAADPVFSHETGIYTNASITLTIIAPAGASIRYTRDGTVPTTNSTLYSGPVSFTNNSTFKARVFQSGVFPSRVVGRNFIFLDGSAANFNSNLPLLIISTEGRGMSENVPPGGTRTRGAFALIDTFRGRSSIRATPDVHGFLEIEVAGQTSAGFAKRPYRFEIQDELLHDRDVSLLGMPADADWRLRNPINDKTMLNDFMAFELFEKMGHYSVRRKFVEVFVDTGGGRLTYPGDYVGVEVLCENIKVNNDRVNIPEITPFATNEPAISGGYIFKKDKVSVGDLDFATPGSPAQGFSGQALKLHEPKPNFLRTAQGVTTSWPGAGYTAAGTNQMRYLSNYLARMEGALYAPNWLSLTGTNHYSHYLDVDSFVDTHWVVEFPKQIDGYRLSGFFTKDRNGKVASGPIWDWNLAYGNADYLEGGYTNGWYFAVQSEGMTANEHIWLRRLMNGNAAMGAGNTLGPGGDPDFNQKIADRWSVLRTNICSLSNTLARIDELSTLLSEAAARDLWGKYRASVVGIGNWPNPGGAVDHNGTPPGNDANPGRPWDVDFFHPTNYLGSDSNSIIWQMKKWMTGRFNWIDAQFTRIPTLSATDGMVTNGFSVTITGPPGVAIYYTLDGSDPRGFQGVTNGVRYTGPITVNGNTRVVARARGSSQFYNTWSGPTAATLYTGTPALRISEIMYHPLPPPPGSTNSDEDFEYIEVKNTGATPLNVNGFSLGGGIQFVFPNVVLQPGELAVVVKNIAAFQSRYGTGITVLGVFTGNLDNAGENIVLLGGVREPILDFSYDDDWYPTTDGLGFALTIVDENAARDTWGLASSWRAGSVVNGSPGQDDPALPTRPMIVVSEALTHTDPPAVDSIELHNTTAAPVDIGGWFLSDDVDTPKKYVLPAGTIIPAGGYVVFNETDHFGAGFGLSSLGDDVWLFSGDGVNLTGYAHGFDFGPSANGVSFGRHVISTGADHFVAQAANTPGVANAGPLVGPVVVTEIHYTPWDVTVSGTGYNNTEDEFVELYNSSSNPVPLYDVNYPTNSWRLRDAVDFEFPTGVSIPGQGSLLVVSFDPANTAALDAFRAHNSVPASVPVYGPFSGRLDNEGDSVELVRPDVPQPPISEDPGLVPYILVERVRYSNMAPWPSTTNGIGFSLQRVDVSAYANDPANWALGGSSAGSQYSGGTAPAITGQPANTNVVAYYGQATMRVTANGTGPLRYQWRFGSLNINDGTNATLLLSNVQPSDEGLYSVIVFNQAGYVASSSAFLDVLIPAAITSQPTNLPIYVASTNIANYGQNARVVTNPGISNATFRIAAVSERAMSFQWYHDDVLIPGANGNVYTIDNITLDHNGEYYCVVTDAISYVPSQRARLNVAVVPFVSSPYPEFQTNRHPQPITALVGEDVTFGVVHGGTPPFGYRWRLNSQPLTPTNNNYTYSPFFTVNNVQTSATVRTYSVVITNLGNQAPGLLSPPGGTAVTAATLTVLADTDGDGAPDTWETQFGFNAADGGDGSQDADGDGASNAAEWRAGTNPTNASSNLKVDSISVTGSTLLSFVALAGKSYQIEVRDSLNPGVWSPLTFVAAASTNRTISVLDTNAATRRYYRLATPLQQN